MPETLAQKVRTKYPGVYDDLTDTDLESKVTAKYPGVYDDIPKSSAFGLRADGTPKGNGFLGPLKRPDGSVSSEISIGINIDGKEIDVPTLVPTLTAQERDWLLTNDIRDPKQIPPSIVQKAADFARTRIKAGKSPFAEASSAPTHERTWGDTAADVAGGVRAGVANTVYGGGDLIRRGLGMERIIDKPDVKAAMTPPQSTAGKVGFAGEQIGEFFLPTGLVGKAGKLAEVVKAGALSAAQSGGDPTTAAVSAGLAAIPGEAIAARVGKALKSSAVDTMAASLKATKEWAKAESEKLAPEMLKRGVGGSIKALRTKAKEMASKVGANLHDAYEAAAAAGETVPGNVIQGNIQLASDSLHTIAANGTRLAVPGNEAAIEQLRKLEEFVGQLPPNIPVNQAAAIKQQFDDIAERAGLFGPKSMASASEKAQGWSFKQASDSFRALLNTNPTLADLNKEASFWIGLRKVADATKLRRVGQTGGLIAAGTGGAGAVAGALSGDSPSDRATKALLGGLAGRQLVRILQSPAYLNKISAPLKNELAEALASGSAGRLTAITSRIAASLPAQFSPSVTP